MRDYEREFRQLQRLFRVSWVLLVGANVLFVASTAWYVWVTVSGQ